MDAYQAYQQNESIPSRLSRHVPSLPSIFLSFPLSLRSKLNVVNSPHLIKSFYITFPIPSDLSASHSPSQQYTIAAYLILALDYDKSKEAVQAYVYVYSAACKNISFPLSTRIHSLQPPSPSLRQLTPPPIHPSTMISLAPETGHVEGLWCG